VNRGKKIGIMLSVVILLSLSIAGVYIVRKEATAKLQTIVKFSDPNIEEQIRIQVGRLKGNITTKDISHLKGVYISSIPNGLKNLNDLKYFTNVETLQLGKDKLKDISFLSSFHKLKRIDLSGNQISDVSTLKKLKNLIDINLAYNKISDINSLAEMKQLTYIDLRDNPISNVIMFKKLTNLYCLGLVNDTSIPKSQINELRKVLPKARIDWYSIAEK
jgi:Leucine-rich repeat (LRR) protein